MGTTIFLSNMKAEAVAEDGEFWLSVDEPFKRYTPFYK